MIRTTRSRVTFSAPFTLPEVEEAIDAGTYDVETDEEVVEGIERTTFIRVATLLRCTQRGTTQTLTINPEGLRVALEADAARTAELGRDQPLHG